MPSRGPSFMAQELSPFYMRKDLYLLERLNNKEETCQQSVDCIPAPHWRDPHSHRLQAPGVHQSLPCCPRAAHHCCFSAGEALPPAADSSGWLQSPLQPELQQRSRRCCGVSSACAADRHPAAGAVADASWLLRRWSVSLAGRPLYRAAPCGGAAGMQDSVGGCYKLQLESMVQVSPWGCCSCWH